MLCPLQRKVNLTLFKLSSQEIRLGIYEWQSKLDNPDKNLPAVTHGYTPAVL